MAPKKLSKEKAREMLSECEALYEESLSYLDAHRDEVLENIAFYVDIQKQVKNNEFVIEQETGEENELFNIILPIVRAATAATLSNQINISIPSTQGDQRSRAKAEAAEELARAFQHNGVIDYETLYNTVLWSKVAMLGFTKAFWDPNAGRCITYDDTFENEEGTTVEKETDPFGSPVPVSVYEGEIRTEFVSCIDGLPDPSITCAADFKKPGAYFFHRKLLPHRTLEDMYPEDVFGEKTKGRWGVGRKSLEQVAFGELTGSTDFVNTVNSTDQNTLCEVVEFWQMPTKQFPNGRLIIFSDSLILVMGPNPLRPHRLPFVPLKGDNPVPGTLWSRGVVSSLKYNQRALNRTKSKIYEMVNKLINGRVWAPFTSGVDEGTLGDIPGQVVGYNLGHKPETEPPIELPSSLFNYITALQEETKYASGYGDVSQGMDSPNITSGRQYAFAKEASSNIREPDMKSYRVYLISLIQHCLLLARQFYDDGRMIRVTGEDSRWVLKQYRSDTFDVDNDIVIETDSTIPDSKAQRFSEVLELAAADLFNNENPNSKGAMKLLTNSYYRSSTFDPDVVHRDRAKRQIMAVIEGTQMGPIEVNPFDNHSIWLEEVNQWRATTEYDDLPPEAKELIFDASEAHESYLQDQFAVLGQDQAAMQGAGAGPPGPPPSGPGAESPLDGGHPMQPAPAPTMQEFVESNGSADAGGNGLVQGPPQFQ